MYATSRHVDERDHRGYVTKATTHWEIDHRTSSHAHDPPKARNLIRFPPSLFLREYDLRKLTVKNGCPIIRLIAAAKHELNTVTHHRLFAALPVQGAWPADAARYGVHFTGRNFDCLWKQHIESARF